MMPTAQATTMMVIRRPPRVWLGGEKAYVFHRGLDRDLASTRRITKQCHLHLDQSFEDLSQNTLLLQNLIMRGGLLYATIHDLEIRALIETQFPMILEMDQGGFGSRPQTLADAGRAITAKLQLHRRGQVITKLRSARLPHTSKMLVRPSP